MGLGDRLVGWVSACPLGSVPGSVGAAASSDVCKCSLPRRLDDADGYPLAGCDDAGPTIRAQHVGHEALHEARCGDVGGLRARREARSVVRDDSVAHTVQQARCCDGSDLLPELPVARRARCLVATRGRGGARCGSCVAAQSRHNRCGTRGRALAGSDGGVPVTLHLLGEVDTPPLPVLAAPACGTTTAGRGWCSRARMVRSMGTRTHTHARALPVSERGKRTVPVVAGKRVHVWHGTRTDAGTVLPHTSPQASQVPVVASKGVHPHTWCYFACAHSHLAHFPRAWFSL